MLMPLRPGLSLTKNTDPMAAITIKEGMSKRQIAAALKKLKTGIKRKRALPDIRQFAGTITLKEDPMVIQKKLRDEWR